MPLAKATRGTQCNDSTSARTVLAGRSRLRGLLGATLCAFGLGCSGAIPRTQLADARATEHADSLATSVERVAAGFTNFGRLDAVRARAEQLGFTGRIRSEWIDWFSFQQNLMIELPGRTPQLIYIVAHYDKVDGTPLSTASALLNGLLDPLIAPLYISSGAVDNGTGVAVALELAKELDSQPHAYTYRILLVGSEEMGLRGSRAHVARLPRVEKDAIALAVILDTTGLTYAKNCIMDVSDPAFTRYAREAAASLGLTIGYERLPSGASSDFEPFQKTSFASDFLRGIKFNLIGGLLPQRSWFTGEHQAPVVFFSSCDLLGTADIFWSALMLPLARLHGPRDRLSQIDPKRLYEQYAISLRMLQDIERD